MSLGDAMRIIELQDELAHVRRQVTMHHNGMVDIAIMLEEGDYDAALDKANSFITAPDEPVNDT